MSKTSCFTPAPLPLPHDVGVANRWNKSTRMPRLTEVQGVGTDVHKPLQGARVA